MEQARVVLVGDGLEDGAARLLITDICGCTYVLDHLSWTMPPTPSPTIPLMQKGAGGSVKIQAS